MPANPIQRKARNSFLLGMLIMLLIAAIAIIVVYLVFPEIFSGNLSTGKGESVSVYKLTKSIKSGEKIDSSYLTTVTMASGDLPADYVPSNINLSEYKSKVDLQAGTVLSGSLIYQGEKLADSARLVEFNMLTLPSTLRVGDYIDVRFTVPSGQNFIVLSKKQVMSLKNTTVSLYLTEDEILMMSGAIIESYIMKASNLQVIQYVEAGVQEASTPTYSVNNEVYQLIQSNAQKGINIEDYGKINDSYNADIRNIINQELGQYTGNEITNIQEGIDKEKETSMELYLSGLEGY